MQSCHMGQFGDILCGVLVSDSLNMPFRGDGNILARKYEKQIFWDLYYEDFQLKDLLKKLIEE